MTVYLTILCLIDKNSRLGEEVGKKNKQDKVGKVLGRALDNCIATRVGRSNT